MKVGRSKIQRVSVKRETKMEYLDHSLHDQEQHFEDEQELHNEDDLELRHEDEQELHHEDEQEQDHEGEQEHHHEVDSITGEHSKRDDNFEAVVEVFENIVVEVTKDGQADIEKNDVAEYTTDEEEVTVEENVPTPGEIKEELERRLFGGVLPKAKLVRKPNRTGKSERAKGRGGRNEKASDVEHHDGLVISGVDYILHKQKTKDQGEEVMEEKAPPIFSSSPLKIRRGKRKAIHINFDDLSDDD